MACTGLIPILSATSVAADTLADAAARAMATHPSVESIAAEKDVASEIKAEARADYFPVVNVSASAGRMYGDNATSRGLTTTRGAAYSNFWDASTSIVQPLYDGSETSNRVDAAELRVQSSDFKLRDVQQTVALEAVQSYLNVLRAKAAYEETRAYDTTLADYQERIKAMVESGAADTSETAQGENIRLHLQETLAEREGDMNAAMARYITVVGGAPSGDLLKPAILDVALAGSRDQAIATAKNTHPALLENDKLAEAAQYDIDAEKSTLYPDLNAEMSYLESDRRESLGGEVVDARALLRANWAISTGGAELARIRQRKASAVQMNAQRKGIEREIERNVLLAYTEMDTAKKQVGITQERERVTRELFESYQTQFEGARVRLLQLMQTENQLFTARLERIDAEYRLLMAQYALMASAGKLQAAIDGTSYVEASAPAAAVSMAAPAEEKGVAAEPAPDVEAVPAETVPVEQVAAPAEAAVREDLPAMQSPAVTLPLEETNISINPDQARVSRAQP